MRREEERRGEERCVEMVVEWVSGGKSVGGLFPFLLKVEPV